MVQVRIIVTGLRTPRTDDMRAMLSDLHEAGACRTDWHGRVGVNEALKGLATATRRATEAMIPFNTIILDPPWNFRHAVR